MSEVYDGVVFKAKKAEIEEFLSAGRLPAFDLKEVADETFLIIFDEGDGRRFYDESETVAREGSARFHKSVLFQYDSRVGHRSSALFVDGELTKSFGAEDEFYVILDEKGYPRENAPWLHASELLDDEEYETAKNAIDFGLEQINPILKWSILRDFLDSA